MERLYEHADEGGPTGRRGKHPHANHSRDFVIANAVHEVVMQDGFRPTRNRGSKHELACSIDRAGSGSGRWDAP